MVDPYLDTDLCVDRLLKQYYRSPKLIIAVDFDDTVYDFHKAGHSYPIVLDLLRRCKKLGFYVVLYTASAPDRHNYMVGYLGINGVAVDSVNANTVDLPYGKHGKIFYNLLLDDRAGLGQAVDVLRTVVEHIEKGKS